MTDGWCRGMGQYRVAIARVSVFACVPGVNLRRGPVLSKALTLMPVLQGQTERQLGQESEKAKARLLCVVSYI